MKKKWAFTLLAGGLAAVSLSGCKAARTQTEAGTEQVQETQSQESGKTDGEEENRQWQFSFFGTSTANVCNTMEPGGSLESGITLNSCTIKEDGSVEKKGGKFAAGEGYDGISYYYTSIDPETENFVLKADVTIDYINPTPDGQEGAALLARDSVGENGEADCSYFTNSAAVIGSKLDYYGEDGKKQSIKDGLGYRMITGVASDTTPPDAEALTLDSLAFVPDVQLAAGDTYTLELSKTNTGYVAAYYSPDGTRYEHILYGADALSKIDKDSVYVGFAVARGCNASFDNIEFTVTDAESDPPAQERPVTQKDLSFSFLSAHTTGSEDYSLAFKANADGTAQVLDGEGNPLGDPAAVLAGEIVKYPCKAALGDNRYIVEFTPAPEFMFDAYTKLTSYDKASFEYTVSCRELPAGQVYVSPSGNPQGNGGPESPVDIETAFQYAKAGQTILLEEGVYSLSEGISIPRGVDGSEEAPIVLKPLSGKAVFDFGKTGSGWEIGGDYWQISGIEVCRSSDGNPGIRLSGHYNRLERIVTWGNGNTGLQISGDSQEGFEMWPSNNTVLNCTSYSNMDAAMEDADGFAAKLTCGEGNVFKGCVAAYNADDGWDLFAKIATGKIGAVTIEDCVAFKNGYVWQEDGTVIDAGNGNGFKMGGSGISGAHILKNSISYENKAKGIDSNSGPDIEIYNNISYNNEGANIALYTANKADTAYVAEGNISFGTGERESDILELKGQDESRIYSESNYFYDSQRGTYANSAGDTIGEEDFVSLDTHILPKRNEDGSLDMGGLLERK